MLEFFVRAFACRSWIHAFEHAGQVIGVEFALAQLLKRLQVFVELVFTLPLLLGIGVAFNIYYVVAWRAGTPALLQSPLTRAVVFSALTTASGFGSLWLSSHPGTASMGQLLIISLGWTLFTTLFFLPALLGPPPRSP